MHRKDYSGTFLLLDILQIYKQKRREIYQQMHCKTKALLERSSTTALPVVENIYCGRQGF
jgi:hypothetical protein